MSWHNAPSLRKLTATQTGGPYGAQLWGADYKGTLYSTYQLTPGGAWSDWRGPDSWFGWSPGDFENKLRAYEITTAIQNNTLGRVWVVSLDQELHSMGMQLSSPVDWEKYLDSTGEGGKEVAWIVKAGGAPRTASLLTLAGS